MEILMFIMQREVIIALAIGGAFLAIIGNIFDAKGWLINHRSAQVTQKAGYAISWLSVAFFIAVGFFQ